MDEQGAVDHVLLNCGKALTAAKKGDVIYRGKKTNFLFDYTDPSKGKPRVSRNTSNHMTLLMDNLPSWKGWPKRSRSLICTTRAAKTVAYGKTYVVLPEDNVKMGVCYGSDIWVSFPYAGINSWHDSVNDFNKYLKIFVNDESWPSLKKGLNIQVDDIQLIDYDAIDYGAPEIIKDWKHLGSTSEPNLTLYDHLNKILDPKKNKFLLKKAGDVLPNEEREVWVGGPCVLINLSTFYQLIDERKF